ncbi:MAG: tripartite tricarboxylate transporter substrate binding protein [Burkholderiales bacterium]|nr:tripartite tricarboxylate transporter substrate binding protein [Burkholderiales bacterium]
MSQAYPAKPVRMVVGFAPGGSTDVVARLLARRLADSLGRSFVVENRAGAASNIAGQLVARSPADGYTLLYMTSTMTVNVSLYPRLPYDLAADFAPVAPVVDIPSVLAVHPSLPVKTVQELIALARARPGEVSYGSAGSGSATHLATELFKSMAGIDIAHVPYKGAGPAMNDFLGGHVQVLFVFNATLVEGNAKAGRLRPLAVTTRQRLPGFPALPTMQEAGIRGYEASVWNGVLAPSGTPGDIVLRLNAQIAQAVKELTHSLTEIGAFPMQADPGEFAAFVKSEVVKWAGVVKRSGVKVE